MIYFSVIIACCDCVTGGFINLDMAFLTFMLVTLIIRDLIFINSIIVIIIIICYDTAPSL